MKLLTFTSILFLAVGLDAKPGLLAPVLLSSSQYHTQDQLGQYSYGYSNPQSAKAEVKTADGITQGSYSYVDAEGKLQSVHYTSDEINGFRVAATNLPAPVLPLVAPTSIVQHDTIDVSVKAKPAEEQQENQEQLIQFDHQQDEQANEQRAKPLPLERSQPTVQTQTTTIHTQALPILRTSLLTYHSPALLPTVAHLGAPGFAYSYGYGYPQYAYVNHLTPIAYSQHITSHVPAPAQLPIVQTETPEVARARAEHIKAHEQAKARNL
ncbi:uncharacterized protein [Atheta coriaria]|uniref:uncharacterized protein n=1 Tax=Dalotia coriaria TaxID=877792 RepID=UPI0031F3DBD0